MRILMLAWRDLMHPLKGGAEVVTDKYLSGLAKKGHKVTLFTERYKGSRAEEELNGYKIIRKGRGLSVYVSGLLYAFLNKSEYDIVVDQVNTIPFFTPLLIPKRKRVGFFHQLCLDVWFYEKCFPIALIGVVLEWLYLKLYWNTKCFVVSGSTKKDLVGYAFCDAADVLVVENQIDISPLARVPAKEKGSFCCVGRLKKSKRFDDCVRAVSLVSSAKLYIVGEGDDKGRLMRLAYRLGVSERVVFTGRVSDKERDKIMGLCSAILVTSVREGWGLIVTEANANGTFAITYNVPGLRDANKTGFVCKRNTYKELARVMRLVMEREDIVKEKSREALLSARNQNDWSSNIKRVEEWMKRS